MGYVTRNHGVIKTFTPDNDSETLYIDSDVGLIDMLEQIRTHFPNTPYTDLTIEAEHIHTDCLTYDQYDPTDYTNYIVVRKQS